MAIRWAYGGRPASVKSLSISWAWANEPFSGLTMSASITCLYWGRSNRLVKVVGHLVVAEVHGEWSDEVAVLGLVLPELTDGLRQTAATRHEFVGSLGSSKSCG